MKTNYDFWYIKRNDEGYITEAGVYYCEGDYYTVQKMDYESMQLVQVTEYKRTKVLEKHELGHEVQKSVKDSYNADAFIYTANDFGNIKTDDELCAFLESERKKDKSRELITEQNSERKK